LEGYQIKQQIKKKLKLLTIKII